MNTIKLIKFDNIYSTEFNLEHINFNFKIKINQILSKEYSKNIDVLLKDVNEHKLIKDNFYERCLKNNDTNNFIPMLSIILNSELNNPLNFSIIDYNLIPINLDIEITLTTIPSI